VKLRRGPSGGPSRGCVVTQPTEAEASELSIVRAKLRPARRPMGEASPTTAGVNSGPSYPRGQAPKRFSPSKRSREERPVRRQEVPQAAHAPRCACEGEKLHQGKAEFDDAAPIRWLPRPPWDKENCLIKSPSALERARSLRT
jgi:hypothetical protein